MKQSNKLLKALGLVIGVVLLNEIQTSRNEKCVRTAYNMGVEDGVKIERHNAEVKSRAFENDITRTKYSRYAKVVE